MLFQACIVHVLRGLAVIVILEAGSFSFCRLRLDAFHDLGIFGLLSLDVVAQRSEGLLDAFADLLALVMDQALDEELFEVLVLIELTHKDLRVPEEARQQQVEAILNKLRY